MSHCEISAMLRPSMKKWRLSRLSRCPPHSGHGAVVGIAFPGLQEDLAISKEKLDIPDYVEISADVENFEMGMTMTLATTELFGTIDSDKLDLHKLSDAMAELTDAMDQLMDGSSQLYDGAVPLCFGLYLKACRN